MWRGLLQRSAVEPALRTRRSYFGWNGPSDKISRIFCSDSSDSGVPRYSLSSRRLRERVQSMAGRPRRRGGAAAPPAPPEPLGFVTLPSLTRHIARRKRSKLHSTHQSQADTDRRTARVLVFPRPPTTTASPSPEDDVSRSRPALSLHGVCSGGHSPYCETCVSRVSKASSLSRRSVHGTPNTMLREERDLPPAKQEQQQAQRHNQRNRVVCYFETGGREAALLSSPPTNPPLSDRRPLTRKAASQPNGPSRCVSRKMPEHDEAPGDPGGPSECPLSVSVQVCSLCDSPLEAEMRPVRARDGDPDRTPPAVKHIVSAIGSFLVSKPHDPHACRP